MESSIPNQDTRSSKYYNVHASIDLNEALPTPPCRLYAELLSRQRVLSSTTAPLGQDSSTPNTRVSYPTPNPSYPELSSSMLQFRDTHESYESENVWSETMLMIRNQKKAALISLSPTSSTVDCPRAPIVKLTAVWARYRRRSQPPAFVRQETEMPILQFGFQQAS